MSVIEYFLKKNGIDLKELEKEFFRETVDPRGSINTNKAYIRVMCKSGNISVWGFMVKEHKELLERKDITSYQKTMIRMSLLLAWSELE